MRMNRKSMLRTNERFERIADAYEAQIGTYRPVDRLLGCYSAWHPNATHPPLILALCLLTNVMISYQFAGRPDFRGGDHLRCHGWPQP